jgi:hypothetical protein
MSKSEMKRIAILQGKDMDYYINLELENKELREALEWATSILTVEGAYEFFDYTRAKQIRQKFTLGDKEDWA